MKKIKPLITALVVLIFGYFFINYLTNSVATRVQETKEVSKVPEIKDCGSYFSQKGGNTDNMDRECFLEAYSTCTPAKLYHEVIDPDNHTIKTTVAIDTKEEDKCRIKVQVDNKFTFPENDIYYCYSASKTELNDYSIQIDKCEDRKPLVL